MRGWRVPSSIDMRSFGRHRRRMMFQEHCRAGSNGFAESPPSVQQSKDTLELDTSYPAYMIWGTNTDVGKTIVSAGLSASILSKRNCPPVRNFEDIASDVLYIKPLQTGYPTHSDARFVAHQVSNILKCRLQETQSAVHIRNHTLKVSPAVQGALNLKEGIGMKDLGSYEEHIGEGSHRPKGFTNCDEKRENDPRGTIPASIAADYVSLPSHLTCMTMWAWFDPVSPHLAAEMERATVEDSSVVHSLAASLPSNVNKNCHTRQDDYTYDYRGALQRWAIIETAGGVTSPGPSGNLQCDIYRPLRLPGVLVGDGRLGGISSTITAFESLHVRGYDVEAIILLDSQLGNEKPLRKYLRGRVPVLVLSPLPAAPNADLSEWFSQCEVVFSELQSTLEVAHNRRIQRLQDMPSKAGRILWWPFTQHSMVATGDVTVIDSRCGDKFSVHTAGAGKAGDVLMQQFDASASWWTQGPDERMQPELARTVGYAAARYGHVMFPENVHEPALQCAELLLQGVGKGWAKRVYFSDNGSTAIEIALKIAFRKFVTDHGFLAELEGTPALSHSQPQLKVLALTGSYHGDTLGAMEAQAPSPYTGFLQQPWYSGRGLFLDPPTVHLQRGQWVLQCPGSFGSFEASQGLAFKSRDDIFDLGRDQTRTSDVYIQLINDQLSSHKEEKSGTVAALIIEPVIHGAGGMEMIDPLFQRILVRECQRRNIPVIFDEVFAGCWRLGVESAAELLKCYPDIACFAKLLTGGTIPLAATLATEDVFEAFMGKSKLDALLHGHSYTAHALGCAAAVTSLKYFRDPLQNANLLSGGRLQELWNSEQVAEISCHPLVRRVVTLGTIFACELQTDPEQSGYASTSTKEIIRRLRKDGVHARPLGNVLYLMCGPLTPPQTCSALLKTLSHQLGSIYN